MSINELALILTLGVVFVNGWTDAPNSIATTVCSGAISYNKSRMMCSFFNLLGVIISCFFNVSIASFVLSLASFGSYGGLGMCGVLLTVIVFGIGCFFIGAPSSESHAMICGAIGASFVLTNSMSGLKKALYVFVFMIISDILAVLISCLFSRFIPGNRSYKRLQIFSCSLNSFMHGWQDGQKFIGIILAIFGISAATQKIPYLIVFSVSIVISLGSLLGGKKIINSMCKLTKIDTSSAFSSDIGTYAVLLICSFLGIPISTGNIKSFSIIGAGIGKGEQLNKKIALKLFLTSVATFPICFILGVIFTKALMSVV